MNEPAPYFHWGFILIVGTSHRVSLGRAPGECHGYCAILCSAATCQKKTASPSES
jgi:hypothetical protein